MPSKTHKLVLWQDRRAIAAPQFTLLNPLSIPPRVAARNAASILRTPDTSTICPDAAAAACAAAAPVAARATSAHAPARPPTTVRSTANPALAATTKARALAIAAIVSAFRASVIEKFIRLPAASAITFPRLLIAAWNSGPAITASSSLNLAVSVSVSRSMASPMTCWKRSFRAESATLNFFDATCPASANAESRDRRNSYSRPCSLAASISCLRMPRILAAIAFSLIMPVTKARDSCRSCSLRMPSAARDWLISTTRSTWSRIAIPPAVIGPASPLYAAARSSNDPGASTAFAFSASTATDASRIAAAKSWYRPGLNCL